MASNTWIDNYYVNSDGKWKGTRQKEQTGDERYCLSSPVFVLPIHLFCTTFYTCILAATSHPIASRHPSFPMIIQSRFCWITSMILPSLKSYWCKKSNTFLLPNIHLMVYLFPDSAVDNACIITPPALNLSLLLQSPVSQA